MDLSTLTMAELRELQQRIPQEMKRREAQEKTQVLNETRAFLKARGYSLEEIMGAEAPKAKLAGKKVAPKYRSPSNPELEWTGRGRKPKWVEAWLASGGSMDALVI